MKSYLALLLVLPLGLYTACASKSSSPDKAANADGTVPGAEATPDGVVPEELKKNPIEGIAAATVAIDTGEATDGAIWSATENVLFFTTPLGDGGLYRLNLDGTAVKVRGGDRLTGQIPIGNTLDKAGNLITLEAKRIMHGSVAAAAAQTVLATGYEAAGAAVTAFDTLKNAVVGASGTIYATDPGYFAAPTANRIYLIPPAGKVTVVEAFENVPRPNGIAMTPDGTGLYVGFTLPEAGVKPFIRKYIVNPDGSLAEHAIFVSLEADTTPDGIEVDAAGNVYVATKTGIAVFKDDATAVGVIPVPEQPTGMAFGGADLKTLYITTLGTNIFKVAVNVPGIVQ